MLEKFDVSPDRVPACFHDQRSWADWKKSFAKAATVPCTDCNEQHQAAMLKVGRCERPDALFIGPEDVLLSNNVRWGPSIQRQERTPELERRMRQALSQGLPKRPREALIRWLGKPWPGIQPAPQQQVEGACA